MVTVCYCLVSGIFFSLSEKRLGRRIGEMLILLIITSLVSAILCVVLLRNANGHAQRYGKQMPQRFHAGAVPRIAGVAMVLAWAAGWIWMAVAQHNFPAAAMKVPPLAQVSVWWLTVLLSVGAGVAEDVTHKVHARIRLLLTFLAALIATFGLNLGVSRLDLGAFDSVWAGWPWMHAMVAVVAIGGLPHAFNLIDGYNGLAGTVALICAVTLAYVALQVGDRQLAAFAMALAGATAGFLVWNYPRGLIFAGDGGAYFWGVGLSLMSLILVQRHPQVSPWFPVLLLIYPVWETLFSIYRKVARGQSPGVADALHFHQLIYRRIVRGVFDDDEARRMLMRNNRTSPYLWGFTILTVIPAVLFWNNTRVLMFFAALFVIGYVWAYVSIVRFKVPRWLRH
jgi:UDP-GlcNAc:undecaprenyl-phosphate/decaprenyl-phosphate GlcNAc-1-phosphate transferase